MHICSLHGIGFITSNNELLQIYHRNCCSLCLFPDVWLVVGAGSLLKKFRVHVQSLRHLQKIYYVHMVENIL